MSTKTVVSTSDTSAAAARSLVLLGSTGSIGTQTLEVVSHLQTPPRVKGLASGGKNLQLLAQQAIQYGVTQLAIAVDDAHAVAQLQQCLAAAAAKVGCKNPVKQIFYGTNAASELICAADLHADDTVLNAITGSVGLKPTLTALTCGATVALANKESLVAGGALVKTAMRRPGQIVPVDSEHSAIAQCLRTAKHEKGLTSARVTGCSEVQNLILTASGGPFRGKKRSELTAVTPVQALAHPTWNMGAVVTINSSTLINKGLELIEAHLLFDVEPEAIKIVVHPQSIVHSMVEMCDGATIAQTSLPDMRLPIALGLTWPARANLLDLLTPMDWSQKTCWNFEPLDAATFPAVDLARAAVKASPTHPAVLNAANEQAVQAFLQERLSWLDIVAIDAEVVAAHAGIANPDLAAVLDVEHWARRRAEELIAERSR